MLSIITNFLNLSFYYIIPLWILVLGIIFYIHLQINIQQSGSTKEELKKSYTLFRIYIDRFYVTNKIKTFGLCSIYIFGNSLIFILIRYMYLGQITPLIISPIANNILSLIFIYLKLGITIILYKILLDVLFKSEINKLYLYIKQYRWYRRYENKWLNFSLGEYILGCLRVPCYRIATFTYQGEYIPGNLPSFIHNDELEYHIKNDKLIDLIKKMQELAMQYSIIKFLFTFLAYIVRFFHIHIRGISEHLPYLILFIIFIIEFQNKQFQYIYIASFIFLLIKAKRDLAHYVEKREACFYDLKLSNYFYCNKIDYKIQRISFYQDGEIILNNDVNSYENHLLFREYSDIVDYIFRDFKSDSPYHQGERRKSGVYRRFLLTFTIICIISYLLVYKSSTYHVEGLIFAYIPLSVLFIPVLIMIFNSYKIYYPTSYEEDPTDAEWVYSRKHNIIYWIAAIIQGAILYILLIKPELSVLHNEVLFDMIIKITKTYTVEERIMDIFTLFEASIQHIQMPFKINDPECMRTLTELEQEYLRYCLRQQDFTTIISSTTSLKDLETYIYQFYYNYIPQVLIDNGFMQMPSNNTNNPQILIFFRNTFVIFTIVSLLGIYKVAIEIQDPSKLYSIIRYLWKIIK